MTKQFLQTKIQEAQEMLQMEENLKDSGNSTQSSIRILKEAITNLKNELAVLLPINEQLMHNALNLKKKEAEFKESSLKDKDYHAALAESRYKAVDKQLLKNVTVK